MKSGFIRKNAGFIIFFGFTLFVFLWKQIIMKEGMLDGDFIAQFYPWMKIYAQSVKDFSFPFWSRSFHSGFPLMAEGQIGGFYPLNILMFFLLPFKIAYNYSMILHFMLAGGFAYAYSKKLGADQWGGALAAFLFCFGSAYAGAFCSVVTLKVLVWFPLVLLLFEYFIVSKKSFYIIIAAVIAAMQFLAGHIQLASYAFIFYIVYMLCSFRLNQISFKKSMVLILSFSLLAITISFPQLILTYNLAQTTARTSSSLGFALWGSFSPVCLLNILFPRWLGFLGHQLFIGTFSLIFLLYGVIYYRKNSAIKVLMVVGFLSFFAALGKYNPLYIALLKVTGFYSFRNPAKFLFFTLFCASIISGVGFTRFFIEPDSKRIKLIAKIFSVIIASSVTLFFILKFLLILYREKLISFLQSYVLKHVLGKPYHRYSLDRYMQKVNNVYQAALESMSLNDFFVIFSLIMVFIVLFVSIWIYRNPSKIRRLKAPIFCLIFLDLFIYSFYGTGFTNNAGFNSVESYEGSILSILRSDDELFRIMPFDLKDGSFPFWAMPNANSLVKLDSVAAYTPLAEESYRQRLQALEVIDNSLGLMSPKNEALVDNYKLLRILNVKYLISSRNLNYSFLENVASDKNLFLYKFTDYLPRVFYTTNIKNTLKTQSTAVIKIIEYKDGFLSLEVFSSEDGFVIFSENYYPGWLVYVDDKKEKVIEIEGIIQGVAIAKGRHKVIFKFKPVFLGKT